MSRKVFTPAERYRRTNGYKLREAEAVAKSTEFRVKRLKTALRNWQVKIRRYKKAVAITDAEYAKIQERAKHAGQIRAVRHRLTKAAGEGEQK